MDTKEYEAQIARTAKWEQLSAEIKRIGAILEAGGVEIKLDQSTPYGTWMPLEKLPLVKEDLENQVVALQKELAGL